MRSAINLGLGLLIAAAVPALHAQVANPMTTTSGVKSALGSKGQAAQQPAKPTAKAATPAPAKPAPAKPAAQTPAKPAAQGQAKRGPAAAKPGATASAKPARRARVAKAKPPVKAVEKSATPGAAPSAAESEVKAARRDPFESLLNRSQGKGDNKNLPPGKAGLQVSTLRLDGIVRAPNGMIAVVSNPQSRVYFLREGDHLYDGSVEKITMDGVSFHEEGKDAFGKPVERQVNKRIYSTSSGEQQ
jgi:Tfp pilus assembly protein PilP